MGAFAGSAALLCQELRSDIAVVTLTMNNSCNLECPHCYLQFAQKDKFVEPWVVDEIARSSAEAVAIVGMEPLLNRQSAHKLGSIVEVIKRYGKRVGLVTNGLNAHLMSAETAELLDWLDVSVDGTRATYKEIRGAPVSKLERGIATFGELGVRQINILHTLHSQNIGQLVELVNFGRQLSRGRVILSPYSVTRHEGRKAHSLDINPDTLLHALEREECDLTDCWVVLDLDWVIDPGRRWEFTQRVVRELDGRTVMFQTDPADYGMVRITYDARVMTPRQAMHTRDYRRSRPQTRAALGQLLRQSPGSLI